MIGIKCVNTRVIVVYFNEKPSHTRSHVLFAWMAELIEFEYTSDSVIREFDLLIAC